MNNDQFIDSMCMECGDINGSHSDNCALYLAHSGDYSCFHCPVCKKMDKYELKHFPSCLLLPSEGKGRRVSNERTKDRIKDRLDSKRIISPDELMDIQIEIQDTAVCNAHERLVPATLDDYRLYMRYRDPERNECFLCGVVTQELTCRECKPRLRGSPFDVNTNSEESEEQSIGSLVGVVSDDSVAESEGVSPDELYSSLSHEGVHDEHEYSPSPVMGSEVTEDVRPMRNLVICEAEGDSTTSIVVREEELSVSNDDTRSEGSSSMTPCGNQDHLSSGEECESGISNRRQQLVSELVAAVAVVVYYDYLLFRLLIYDGGSVDVLNDYCVQPPLIS